MEKSPIQQRFALLKKHRSATHRAVMHTFCRNGHLFNLGDTDALLRHIDTLHSFAQKPTQEAATDTQHALSAALCIFRKHNLDTEDLDKHLNQLREI